MNTSLAVTISPPMRTDGKYKQPHKMYFLEDVCKIRQIMRYNRIKTYIFYPEFDGKGRLHYHGIINLNVNQYIRFHKHAIHKLRNIGFVDNKKLNTFLDKLRWITYMKKEWGISKYILELEAPLLSTSLSSLTVIKEDYMKLLENRKLLDYFENAM